MYKPRIEVVFGNERIISPSGMNIVGAMLGKSDLVKRMNRIPVDEKKHSEPQIKNGDIALTLWGCCPGKDGIRIGEGNGGRSGLQLLFCLEFLTTCLLLSRDKLWRSSVSWIQEKF